ncbi:RNA-directed DNA polymerase [Candidatus Saccharibacteria bacterium]|nr:RNA-directed DNA polymerase [Candidatus Saccharibacteria bacterium]
MYFSPFEENPIYKREEKETLVDGRKYVKPEFKNDFQRKTLQRVFVTDKFTRKDLVNQLYMAYMEARRHKRDTEDEMRFEFNLPDNIENLADTILRQTYEPSRGIAFIVKSPVIREIFAAPFRDRVVHHLLFNLSGEWWDRRFIGGSFSCRKGKGTLFGWRKLQKDMRRCSQMGKVPSMIYKFDISGYFMSMQRARLFEEVEWGISRQFKNSRRIYRMTRFLWHEVIFDDPTQGVKIRGKRIDWQNLPRSKSLFCQRPGRGIVIGNLTSQLLSNIFLNQFDQYVKRELHYEFYGRYVDDFYFIVQDKDIPRFDEDRARIALFLQSMGLKLHPKKCYAQPVEHGMDFLGARVFLQHQQPGRRVVRTFHSVANDIFYGSRDDVEVLGSYDGILSHMHAIKMITKVYEHYGWDYKLKKKKP